MFISTFFFRHFFFTVFPPQFLHKKILNTPTERTRGATAGKIRKSHLEDQGVGAPVPWIWALWQMEFTVSTYDLHNDGPEKDNTKMSCTRTHTCEGGNSRSNEDMHIYIYMGTGVVIHGRRRVLRILCKSGFVEHNKILDTTAGTGFEHIPNDALKTLRPTPLLCILSLTHTHPLPRARVST